MSSVFLAGDGYP